MNLLWTSLSRVQALSFIARSSSQTGWNGQGTGSVVIDRASPGVVTFNEVGFWRRDGGAELRFTNVFRWSLLEREGLIRLEHLRFGAGQPVYLFDLKPEDATEWVSVTPHVCREDCYSAHLRIGDNQFELTWTIRGPKKDEEIQYVYLLGPI